MDTTLVKVFQIILWFFSSYFNFEEACILITVCYEYNAGVFMILMITLQFKNDFCFVNLL